VKPGQDFAKKTATWSKLNEVPANLVNPSPSSAKLGVAPAAPFSHKCLK
jgi:hypothetical protein